MNTNLPLVIFDGNCQGQHLSAILAASNLAESYAIGQDLGFLPSHLGVACRCIDEETAHNLVIEAKQKGRWVVQGTQSTPMSDETTLSYTPFVDQVIRYPHLQFYAASPDEALQRFGPRATPQRMFDMDLGIIETCQKRSGTAIDFAEFIRENAQKRPLFHTALHPNGEITARMVRSFASQIPNADDFAISCAERYLERNEGINSSTYHPVRKDVLEALGFDWGAEYELYRQLLDRRSSGDWGGIIDNQAVYAEKFGNDTWCWLALTQAHTAIGSMSEAKICLSRLLDLNPGHVHSWLHGLNLFLKHNDHDGISALIHRARAFFRGQRIFSQMMAYFCLNTGKAVEAEPFARDYHARTPDRADALVPLLKTLTFLSRHEEIRQIVNFEVSVASPSRMAEIRANFNGSPELEEYLPAE